MIPKTIRAGSLVGIFIFIVSMMAMPVASASANGKVIAKSEAVLEGGGGTVKCPAAGYEGEWELVKPTSTTEPKWEKQEPSNPAKDIQIKNKFPTKGCIAESGIIKAAATIESCSFHIQLIAIREVGGVLKGEANGSVLSTCVIKVATCEIIVPRKENSERKEVELENVAPSNMLINTEVSEITAEPKGLFCPVLAAKTFKLRAKVEASGVQILKGDDF